MNEHFHGMLTTGWVRLYLENPHQSFEVTHASFCNTSNATRNFSLCIVGPKDIPSKGNSHYWGKTIAGNDTVEHPAGFMIPPNHALFGLASAGDSISYSFSGVHK